MLKNRPFISILTLVVLAVALLVKGQAPAGAFNQAVPADPVPELLGQIGGVSYAVAYESIVPGLGNIYVGFGPRLYIYGFDSRTGTPILTLLGISDILPDFIQGISMVGNFAYVTLGESGLAVVNCTLKNAPIMIGHYDTPGFARGLYMTATTAYVADGPSGVQVLNVSTPSAITSYGSYNTPGDARDVIPATDDVLGQFFYVADGLSGLRVLDLKNMSTPVEIGYLDTNGFAEALDVQKNFIHLADGSTGWKKIQISNPSEPQPVSLPGYPRLCQGCHVLRRGDLCIGWNSPAWQLSRLI